MSKGQGPSSYAPIARLLSELLEDTLAKLCVKFDSQKAIFLDMCPCIIDFLFLTLCVCVCVKQYNRINWQRIKFGDFFPNNSAEMFSKYRQLSIEYIM